MSSVEHALAFLLDSDTALCPPLALPVLMPPLYPDLSLSGSATPALGERGHRLCAFESSLTRVQSLPALQPCSDQLKTSGLSHDIECLLLRRQVLLPVAGTETS